MNTTPTNHRQRLGFTLFELMMVLVVIVAVAAVAWPSLHRVFLTEHLRQGADQVRAAWGRARVAAIETGVTQAFRIQPGLGVYFIEPWSAAELELEATPTTPLPIKLEQLPEGVVFDNVRDLTSFATNANQLGAEAQPILFHPDGTTSNMRLTLRDQQPLYVVVEMRGLTGASVASDLLTVEELPR